MSTPLDFSGTNPVGTPSALDVSNAGQEAISFKEQLPDLEAKLREALTTKFNESPLFKQRETAMQSFLAAPSAINADISNIQKGGTVLSPTQQQEISGGRRAAAFAPLSTANLLLNSQFGGLENMMAGGVKAFEAASEAKTGRANLMNTMRQQEIERQFKEQGIALDWAKLGESQAKDNSKAMKEMSDASSGINNWLEKIQSVRGLIRSTNVSTGFVPGLMFQLQKRGILGKPTEEKSRASTAISDLNTQLFEIAGKAFTGPEKSLLEGLVVGIGSDKSFIEQQLNQMEIIATRKRDELIRQFLME
jgi:hypothetical protein